MLYRVRFAKKRNQLRVAVKYIQSWYKLNLLRNMLSGQTINKTGPVALLNLTMIERVVLHFKWQILQSYIKHLCLRR